MLGMDHIPQVFPVHPAVLRRPCIRKTDLGLDAGLVQEKAEYAQVQFEKSPRTIFEQAE